MSGIMQLHSVKGMWQMLVRRQPTGLPCKNGISDKQI